MTRENTESDGVNEADIRFLIREISRHEDWKPSNQKYCVDLLAKETVQSSVELWFEHRSVNSALRFILPSECIDYVAEATLVNSFIQCENVEIDHEGFLYELSKAHCRIAENMITVEYCHSLADPDDIMKIKIPYQYQSQVLNRSLSDAAKAAEKTQQLHNNIINLVTGFK